MNTDTLQDMHSLFQQSSGPPSWGSLPSHHPQPPPRSRAQPHYDPLSSPPLSGRSTPKVGRNPRCTVCTYRTTIQFLLSRLSLLYSHFFPSLLGHYALNIFFFFYFYLNKTYFSPFFFFFLIIRDEGNVYQQHLL